METINKGLVFLEKDWDGGRLPEDLVEESGMIGSTFSIIESEKSARLGGYVKRGGEVHFLVNKNEYGQILWFNDKNNIKPFFSYGHKLSELKI